MIAVHKPQTFLNNRLLDCIFSDIKQAYEDEKATCTERIAN